jgi:hypothetical protein
VYSGSDGAIVHVVDGFVEDGGLGFANQLCGDLDGDGRSEFASSTHGGPVYVFSGKDASLLRPIPPPASWPCDGWLPLASADLDSDGVADLVLGCPAGSPPDPFGAGAAAAVSGVDGSVLWLRLGTTSVDRFGYALAGVGDHDRDGVEDFVVGAPAWWDILLVLGPEFGSLSYAQLLSGASGELLRTYLPDPAPDDPGDQNPRFGWSVGGGGDVDGDGFPDVLIGETKKHVDVEGHEVFSGKTAATLHESHDGSGYTVRDLGDVDGDGFDDYLGSHYGLPRVFSGGDFEVIYTLALNHSFRLGSYAAAAGDVDGDDFPDVVIGDDSYLVELGPPTKIQGRLTMFSLIPAGVTALGAGCPGFQDEPPRIGVRGSPKPGATLSIHLSKAAPGVHAFLALGLSSTSWAGLELPLDLAALGMPGCALLTSPDVLVHRITQSVPPAPGRASVELRIPADPGVLGAAFHAQWLVGPGDRTPASVTRALRFEIG